jgi:hypothetical protein
MDAARRSGRGARGKVQPEVIPMHGFLQAVVNFAGHAANRPFAELPRLCPMCDHHMEPWRLAARSTSVDDTRVDFAFQCPRDECRHIFVSRYHLGPDSEFDLDRQAPAERVPLAIAVQG